jgi:hypothetical protein
MNEGIIRRMDELIKAEESIPFIDGGKVVTYAGGDAKIRVQAMKEMRQAVIKEMEKHE